MTIIRGQGMADYFASANASSTKLKHFDLSPKLYYDTWVARTLPGYAADQGDPDASGEEVAKESRALMFGKAFEMLLTDTRAFDKAYVCKPTEGKTSNFATVEGKAWKKAAEEAGKVILTPRELASMNAMRASLEENREAMALLEGCEQQVVFTGELFGIGIQSRPDFVNLNGCALSEFAPYTMDLKTVADMDKFASGSDPIKFGYHRQAAIARTCLEKNSLLDFRHYLLACEKAQPNRTVVFELDAVLLEHAEQWLYARVRELATCHETNTWPRSRGPNIRVLGKPNWLKDED